MDIFSENRLNSQPTKPHIISIGSGKGGVGKSFLSSSLAITLSKKGKKVLAVDLDFGGANLHTSLGMEVPLLTLSQFFASVDKKIENYITSTENNFLSLLAGTNGSAEAIHMTSENRTQFLKKLKMLPFDYIFLDLGAGTYHNSIDFFCESDQGIIVILPEPTSIENAYRFIKSTYYEIIKNNTNNKTIQNWIDMASGKKPSKIIRSPCELFQNIKNLDLKEFQNLKNIIQNFTPHIIINQTRTLGDSEIGNEILLVCKKYFGIQCNLLGSIEYDTAVWQSIRRKKNIINEMPNSQTTIEIENICNKLQKLTTLNKNWENLIRVF